MKLGNKNDKIKESKYSINHRYLIGGLFIQTKEDKSSKVLLTKYKYKNKDALDRSTKIEIISLIVVETIAAKINFCEFFKRH
jgi:hypothetical protein